MWIVIVYAPAMDITVFGPYASKELAAQDVTNIEDTFPEMLTGPEAITADVVPMLSGEGLAIWFATAKEYRS